MQVENRAHQMLALKIVPDDFEYVARGGCCWKGSREWKGRQVGKTDMGNKDHILKFANLTQKVSS